MQSAKKILLVEDDQAIREMMKSVLELEGYSVTVAADGYQGIEKLKTESPNAILLDMMMPVLNGWDFLDYVRARPTTAAIPVIVVSAYGEIAKSVRPHAYVPKPVQLKTLLSALDECAA